MFGLRLRGRKVDSAQKAKPKFSLEQRHRVRLYVLVTVVLFSFAIATIALESVHPGPNPCSGILLSSPRDSCYLSLANYTLNATMCNAVSNPSSRAGCVTAIALTKANATLCGGLSNSSYYYGQCVSQVSVKAGSPSGCKSLPEPYMSSCIYSFAQSQGFSSNSTCSLISNATQRAQCSGVYDYKVAVSTKAPSYCAPLPNTTDSAMISAMVEMNASNYTSAFQQMAIVGLNLTPQGYCYYKLATITSDYGICAGMPGILGQICSYANLAYNQSATSLNTSACSSAPQQIKSVCGYALAIDTALTTKNVSACYQITSTSYRYTCISAYATKYNSTYCSQIPNATYRQSCYGSAGNATVNSSGAG